MYVGRDFDPSDTGESERYTLDFVNDLQSGDTIVSAIWTCEVAAKSEATDPSAAAHVDGTAIFSGTKTTQRITGMLPGVTYCLTATVTSALQDVVSLWSHIECKDPA